MVTAPRVTSEHHGQDKGMGVARLDQSKGPATPASGFHLTVANLWEAQCKGTKGKALPGMAILNMKVSHSHDRQADFSPFVMSLSSTAT